MTMSQSCPSPPKETSDPVLTAVTFALTYALLLLLLIAVPVLYVSLRSKLYRLRSLKKEMREENRSKQPPLTRLLEDRAHKPKPTLICNMEGQIWLPIATKVADGWSLRRRLVLLTPSFTPDSNRLRRDAYGGNSGGGGSGGGGGGGLGMTTTGSGAPEQHDKSSKHTSSDKE